MSNYRLGILGGMGPQATNTFYQYIIDRTAAHSDQEHLSMLIFSDNEVPDRTAAILSGEVDPVYDRLLYGARLLEQGGVHRHRRPLQHRPLLFGQGAGTDLHPHPPHGAGGLPGSGRPGPPVPRRAGTDGTIQTGIYQKELAALGMEPRVPSPQAQKKVMS